MTVRDDFSLLVLGRAVRELRARRGLSQEALGFVSGLHRNHVGEIERGEINPGFLRLVRVASGLTVPLSELILLYEARRPELREQQRRGHR